MTQSIEFTPRMQVAIQRADEICRHYRVGVIGTEHLLMALMEDGEGIAGQAVEQLVGRQRVIDLLDQIMTAPGYHPTPQ